MNKELEACFKEIYHEIEYVYDSKVNSKANKNWSNDIKHYDNIRGNVLTIQRYLESIDNANPSEAFECSLKLYKMVESAGNDNGFNLNEAWKYHNTIKQALLKEQEQEKVIKIIKERQVNIALLITVKDVEEYNFYIPYEEFEKYLTKEEFDLLKRC